MTHKDWRGGRASVFKTIGASNHVDHERADNDYYATEPKATRLLTEIETFHHDILEPSCGEGHMAEELIKAGYAVTAYDIVDRGYGKQMDFFDVTEWNGDIITNPPYSIAQQFVQHALDIIPEGHKVAMFLKLTFLEGKSRKELFANTPPCDCGSAVRGYYVP